jgi:branched-chain amino acid transport system ATP-binding protein
MEKTRKKDKSSSKFSLWFGSKYNSFKQNSLRENILKINYRKLLLDDTKNGIALYYDKEIKKITSYYDKLELPIKKQLGGETLNDTKIAKKLSSFENKQYWLRREYIQTLKNASSIQTVDEQLLLDFDANQKLDKENYLKLLNEKYPHISLDANYIAHLRNKISHYEQLRISELKYIDDKKAKKEEKLKNLINRTSIFIVNKEQKNHELSKQIRTYYENEYNNCIDSASKKFASTKKVKVEKHTNLINKAITYVELKEKENSLLAINGLKMYFGGVKAINDLTFNVNKGEIFGLIGPNGAGKTTVFNCITQFYKPTSGNILFKNKENNIVDLGTLKTHDMINEGIARSFQNVELIWELSVLDNLLVAAHSLFITNLFDDLIHSPRLKRQENVLRMKGLEILKTLHIDEYALRSPYGLPYGILKKIELARTLMTDPSLIILDEPAAGLNDVETEELGAIIKNINKTYGITIFLVEHDMGLVMSICDTICAISFGKMLAIGTPVEIQSNKEVRKAYLGDDEDE